MYKNSGAVLYLQRASAISGIHFSDECLWATDGMATFQYGPNRQVISDPMVAHLIDEANRAVFGSPLRVHCDSDDGRKAVRS